MARKEGGDLHLGIWLMVGSATGVVIGSIYGNMGMAISFGTAIGILIGVIVSQRAKAKKTDLDKI